METKFDQISIWGWGLETFQISSSFFNSVTSGLISLGLSVSPTPLPLPAFDELKIPPPRFSLPKKFISFCDSNLRMRLRHTYGKSTRELLKALDGVFENVPDYIAFPKSEAQLADIMVYCSEQMIAIVPFGGGSSVVGGINLLSPERFNGTMVINLLFLNKMLSIEPLNQTATFQAGIYGPDLEKALSEYGFTFRNYPQSFEFSTLGGWLATHSAGHFATGSRTHIDSAVQSLRIVTPIGAIETRKVPPDGAGPYHNPIFLGSEGILGIITEATIKVLRSVKYKLAGKVRFGNFLDGIRALREICQQGIEPANCRLFDCLESFAMGIGKGNDAVLLLGFESVGVNNLEVLMNYCYEICEEFKGIKLRKTSNVETNQNSKESDGDFRDNFTSAPYLRNELLRRGILIETLETVVTWNNFEKFHEKMMENLFKGVEKYMEKGTVTCRITHCYSDGLAPYYTIIGQITDLKSAVEKWDKIKLIANATILEMNGSITHHHSVGRDHGKEFKKIAGQRIIGILKAIKNTVDPKGIMNPEILI